MEKINSIIPSVSHSLPIPQYIWSIHTYEAVVTWKAVFFEHRAAAVCQCNRAPMHRCVEMQTPGLLRQREATCLCTIADLVTTENAAGSFLSPLDLLPRIQMHMQLQKRLGTPGGASAAWG